MSTLELPEALPTPALHGPFVLDWPLPHHMMVIDPAADLHPEQGLVTFVDGGKVLDLDGGQLLAAIVRIDFDAGILELGPGAGPRRVLPFSSFRVLVLPRRIQLERIPLAVPPGSVEALPSRDTRKCAIVFKDGSTLEADVVSVTHRKPGLFLFVADAGDGIERWFVPAQAIGTYRVGASLGQALLDHKSIAREALDAGLQVQERLKTTKIGDYLASQGAVTREQLEAALLRQKTLTHLKLGDALVQEKLITTQQRDAALATQAVDRGKRLGEILVDMGALTGDVIRHVLVEQLGVPSVNLARFQYDADAVGAISADLAREYVAVPLYRTSTRIAVGIENPLWWEALQALESFTGLKVDPAMAARDDILAAIEHLYGAAADPGKPAPKVADPAGEAVTQSDVWLVNKIITDAYDEGASDIHIESMPGDKPSRVRFRIDGVLSPYLDVPSNFRAALVCRLKIMGGIDISARRPQEGMIRFDDLGQRQLELRVLTMPTANGLEDVVMRILTAPRALSLDQLALSPHVLPELKAMAARSFGLVLVCGPAASGTTTTLHSLLRHMNTPERKVWTVEDPIEITQDGLCQVQVDAKLGLSFPEVLRSFLSADPDVIMVGEMRDSETARTVIAASLAGHLVLSTMRTPSAVASVVRLIDLGVDSFNFSDALLGIVGQRLVRRLCTACRTPHVASPDEIEPLAHAYCRDQRLAPGEIAARWRSRYGSSDGTLTLHSAAGCALCDASGYKGRMGVHELLVASPGIKAKIQAKAGSAELLREALDGGMVTLEQDAIEKVLQGHLDFEQVKAARL
jgi:type II secretory ATPase GspE/PulE/Tfp pilus assembly ATPase PilB-like protein